MIHSDMICYFHMPLKLKDMIPWLMGFLSKIVKRCYKEINGEGEDPYFLVHVQSIVLLMSFYQMSKLWSTVRISP